MLCADASGKEEKNTFTCQIPEHPHEISQTKDVPNKALGRLYPVQMHLWTVVPYWFHGLLVLGATFDEGQPSHTISSGN